MTNTIELIKAGMDRCRPSLRFVALALGLLLCAHSESAPIPGEIVLQFQAAPPTQYAAGSSQAAPARLLASILSKYGVKQVQQLVGPAGKFDQKTRSNSAGGDSLQRLVFAPEQNTDEIIQELKNVPGVIYAEPNYSGSLCYAPNDSYYAQQSADFDHAKIAAAWQTQINQGHPAGGSPLIKVAVIDSGVDVTHPDLAAAILPGESFNFADNSAAIYDDIGHGTRVAGIIAATGNNNEGIAGVAFGCKIMSLDVVNSSGSLTSANAASALYWAISHGASIVNMSIRFSGTAQAPFSSAALSSAVSDAENAGLIVVAAAGNENQGDIAVFPAAYPTVIGVGALDEDGIARAPFSNFNGIQSKLVNLMAPGTTVFSTIPGAQYNGTYGSGTSFASPIVAGAAALLRSKYPAQSPSAIRAHLARTADLNDPVSLPERSGGAGRLDALAMISTPMQPRLEITGIQVLDSSSLSGANNDDGNLDPGETANIVITATNVGADAIQVTGTLTTIDPRVSIVSPVASWGGIACGQTKDSASSLTVTMLPGTAAGPADFLLSFAGDDPTYVQTAPFSVLLRSVQNVAPGTYLSAQHWTASKTWQLSGPTNFLAGLTIDPGTTIRASTSATIEIGNGSLSADGSSLNPIRFLYTNDKQDPTVVSDDFYQALDTGVGNWRMDRLGVAVFPDSSVVLAAQFSGTVTLGSGQPHQTTLTSSGNTDVLLAKYAKDGSLAWAKQISCTNNDPFFDTAYAVCAAPDAGFFVTGQIQGTAVFGTGETGAITLPATAVRGNSDIFIAKFDASGHPIWAQRAGGSSTSTDETGKGIALTSDGGCVVAGSFGGAAGFGALADGITTITSSGEEDCFLAKYTSDGHLQWVRGFGSTGSDSADNVAVCPDGSLLVSGFYFEEISFDSGNPNSTLMDYDDFFSCDAYVAKFSAAGTFEWARAISGPAGDEAFGVAATPSNGAVVVGTYQDTAFFGDSATQLTAKGSNDSFVALFDQAGNTIAAKAVGASIGNDAAYKCATLPDGSFYVVGVCRTNAVFGIGEPGEQTIAGFGNEDAYLAKFRPDGTFDWVKTSGGPGVENAFAIGLSPSGEVAIAGRIGSKTTFGAGEIRQVVITPPSTFQLFLARYSGSTNWGGLTIRSTASAATLSNCIFERGTVTNENAGATFSDCQFNRAPGYGLVSSAGTAAVTSCTGTTNRLAAMSLGQRPAVNCAATTNRGGGILTSGTVTNCLATGNYSDGLVGAAVASSSATSNGGRGIVALAGVTSSSATLNRSTGVLVTGGNATNVTAQQNTGGGMVLKGGGTADNCVSTQNTGVGMSTDGPTIQNSTISFNAGGGVAAGGGAATLVGSRVLANGGTAVSGIQSVAGCVVSSNTVGLSNIGSVTGTYISSNGTSGVTSSTVASSTVVGNSAAGVTGPGSVSNSWVVGNAGVGVNGANALTVNGSSVLENGGGGVLNLGAAGASGSNIYGNTGFEARDTQTRGGGSNTKSVENNWWGTSTTALMLAHSFDPFPPSYNIEPQIQDGLDAGANGWYLDYSPPAPGPFAAAPDSQPPTFLVSATPNLSGSSVNVGPTTFTLVFSKNMDMATKPAVSFALGSAPYPTRIVEPAPGWVNSTTWVGLYGIQSDTGNGVNTIRVSGARDASGFSLPDDSRVKFLIATGSLGANNGLIIVPHSSSADLSWEENSKPADTLGYNVLRSSTSGEGPYAQIHATIPAASYIDTGLSAGTYYYMIERINTSFSSEQWTAPVSITMPGSGVENWSLY